MNFIFLLSIIFSTILASEMSDRIYKVLLLVDYYKPVNIGQAIFWWRSDFSRFKPGIMTVRESNMKNFEIYFEMISQYMFHYC